MVRACGKRGLVGSEVDQLIDGLWHRDQAREENLELISDTFPNRVKPEVCLAPGSDVEGGGG